MEEYDKDGKPVLKVDPCEEDFMQLAQREILGGIVVEGLARSGDFGPDKIDVLNPTTLHRELGGSAAALRLTPPQSPVGRAR